jgi:hypothetical protein
MKTTTRRSVSKNIRWSQCPQLSELALMIDAFPHELRIPIVHSAIALEAADLETGYVVGEIRSLLVDSLAQLYGCRNSLWRGSDGIPDLDEAISPLSACQDPAAVQLVVCDLLEAMSNRFESDA